MNAYVKDVVIYGLHEVKNYQQYALNVNLHIGINLKRGRIDRNENRTQNNMWGLC